MKNFLKKSPTLFRLIRFFYNFFKLIYHFILFLISFDLNKKFSHLNFLLTYDSFFIYRLSKVFLKTFINNYKFLNNENIKNLSSYLSMTGQHELSTKFLKHYNFIKKGSRNKSKINYNKYRFIDSKNFGAIGHIAFIDFYLKLDELKLDVPKTNILIDKETKFSNHVILKAYKKYLKHINDFDFGTRIFSSEELGLMNDAAHNNVWLDQWAWSIQKLWIKKHGYSSRYFLDKKSTSFAKKYLEQKGLYKNDWFVVIHIREDGGGQIRGLRNADINSYQRAIEFIIKNGGWVIRIGGNSLTKKINVKSKKFIDLTILSFSIPELDSYVISKCRFFIGTGSGPINIAAHYFCRPILLTNAAPLASRVPWPNQLILPKMYVNKKTKKIMPLSKRLNKIFGILESEFALKEFGYEALQNSSYEILHATIEMISLTKKGNFNMHYLNKNHQQIKFKKISSRNEELCPVFCSEIILNKFPEFLN